jgi:small-conductance mechanosensitive channel
MAVVRSTLEKAIKDIPWRSQQVEPAVLMKEFGDSSVNFHVCVWIENPWELRVYRSDLNEAIWWALKAAGITIAFPQLDVHFDPEIERSMTELVGAGRGRPQ